MKKAQQQSVWKTRLLDCPKIVGSQESEEVLEGVVEDVIFRSDDGRFTVIRLSSDEDGDEETAADEVPTTGDEEEAEKSEE